MTGIAVASPPAPVAIFAALGDPTRQRVLDLLASGRTTSAELAEPLEVTRQAVEKHLKVLSDVGLVEPRRVGRRVAYAVRTEPLSESAAWLRERATTWDRRLAALKRAAEQPG